MNVYLSLVITLLVIEIIRNEYTKRKYEKRIDDMFDRMMSKNIKEYSAKKEFDKKMVNKNDNKKDDEIYYDASGNVIEKKDMSRFIPIDNILGENN